MAVSLVTPSSQLACLVLILGAFGPATNAQKEMPTDYHQIPALNVAYKVHHERKTWAAAKEACITEGAHLAVIDTMVKVTEVAALKRFNEYVWIGIWRWGPGARWLSSGNNFPMPDLPWAPGKPQGSHNCLAVRGCDRGLTNENCMSSLGFVCQKLIEEPDIIVGAQ